MRMLRRCTSYEVFQAMRQRILEECPFALINDVYDSKNGIAYLSLWDSDYFPEEWEEWIIRPKSTASEKPGVSEEYSKT